MYVQGCIEGGGGSQIYLLIRVGYDELFDK